MCEVGSCCGCISLYRGCLLIGLVTVFVSATQLSVFTLILTESYDSKPSNPVNQSIEEADDASFYSFKSKLCPFGFIPLAKPVRTNITGLRHLANIRNRSLHHIDHQTFNSTVLPLTNSSAVANSSHGMEISVLYRKNVTVETIKKISCLAPTQGVLWALVIASGLYAPVGIILIIGVREGMTCFLSTWFFYTVGYNLLALIVALTDGVYTGAADVSSYLVCLVTAYCIIVVDSYYEKLLKNERVESASKTGPSLVVVKSTPNSVEGSPQDPPMYSMPIGRPIIAPPGYLPPGEANELLLPASPYQGRGMCPP